MVLNPTMEFDRSTYALFSRALARTIDSLPPEIAQDNPASLLKQNSGNARRFPNRPWRMR